MTWTMVEPGYWAGYVGNSNIAVVTVTYECAGWSPRKRRGWHVWHPRRLDYPCSGVYRTLREAQAAVEGRP